MYHHESSGFNNRKAEAVNHLLDKEEFKMNSARKGLVLSQGDTRLGCEVKSRRAWETRA